MKISINNIGAYLTCEQIKELRKVIDGLSDGDLKRFNQYNEDSPCEWLIISFIWAFSPQGSEYWYAIYDALRINPNCYKDIF